MKRKTVIFINNNASTMINLENHQIDPPLGRVITVSKEKGPQARPVDRGNNQLKVSENMLKKCFIQAPLKKLFNK
jgi:hypothetical protein